MTRHEPTPWPTENKHSHSKMTSGPDTISFELSIDAPATLLDLAYALHLEAEELRAEWGRSQRALDDIQNIEYRRAVAADVLAAMDVDQYLIDAVRNATPPDTV